MKKLNILITQYNEPEEMVKKLLDSIAMQQNINFEDIEVIIGNDGSDIKLSDEFINQYKYPIQYLEFEHSGLAGLRQKLLAQARAQYIMYCDADDYFISTIALDLIFSNLDDNTNALVCDFLSDRFINNQYVYRTWSKDAIHVHGKVYRLKFLLDNHIVWHPDLKEHQDSPFNGLAMNLAGKTKKLKFLQIPIYLWHENPESISRKNDHHMCRTMNAFINSMDHYIDDLLIRGCYKEASYYTIYLLYYFYYYMHDKEWYDEVGSEFIEPTYKRFEEFIIKYQILMVDNFKSMQEMASKNALTMIQQRIQLPGALTPFNKWFSEHFNSITFNTI